MSFDLTFLMTDTDRSAQFAQANRYLSDKCGICEEEEADIYWPSPTSRWAHNKCLEMIKPTESKLTAMINELFSNDLRKQNTAHRLAVQAVANKCGPDTISVYTARNGTGAITALFDTVGVEAVKKFADVVKEHDQLYEDFKTSKKIISVVSLAQSAMTEFGMARL